ncbi:hypothetical protein BRYFOR_09291 [Marvinbryantia formatexigens DSM 14469]|uniref:Uncharacterized protein n=1 Tax=Marvinbryantia formatexigens DSM 14469 TaxID=478749 RepID=C6LKU3_9FIRM|nr:hypothetical protein BRYFOR_09291 [Marvinbryantia formatexigens DSM 14469]
MHLAVNLGEMVALVLIDKKQVAGLYGVKAVVNEKLAAAGNRKIQLVAVVDMHFHWLFVAVQVRKGKGMAGAARIDGILAGSKYLQKIILLFSFFLLIPV